MEAHFETFVSLLREILGRRLIRVYFLESEEGTGVADANLVILVEERDWTEDYLIHQEGSRIMKETGLYLAPLVVSRHKWEHWRRLGKDLVTRVEKEGSPLFVRDEH